MHLKRKQEESEKMTVPLSSYFRSSNPNTEVSTSYTQRTSFNQSQRSFYNFEIGSQGNNYNNI